MIRLGKCALVLVIVAATLVGRARAAPATPGDLDRSFGGFGVGGSAVIADTAAYVDMARLPDGRIVLGAIDGGKVAVKRLLSDGAADTTFSGDGYVAHAYPGFAIHASSVAVQADGKIVVAGYIATSPPSFLLARLTDSGALDTSFGSDGFVTTDFDTAEDGAAAVLVQPDGKILAAGHANVAGDDDFALARYHPNGGLDGSFGGDGKVTVGFGGEDQADDVTLQEDGKIVLSGASEGFSDQDLAVARLNPDGTLDTTLDGDGKLTTGFGNYYERAQAVAVGVGGNILVAGWGYSGGDVGLLARYLPNGALDSSFDGDGKRVVGSADFSDVALQPDGRIVLAGTHFAPGDIPRFALWRLNGNGTPDSTFDGDGDTFFEFGTTAESLALLPDGRLLALGNGLEGADLLLQLWPDGAFDAGGQQALGFANEFFGLGSHEAARALAVQPDGKLVVAGQVHTPAGSEGDLALARFLPNGQLDTAFGDLGRVWWGFGQFDTAAAVAVQPDGKIVVAGYTDPVGAAANDFLIVRFNPDGSKDQDFGLLGFNLANFMGGDDYGQALALAPDGKLVVAGRAWDGARYAIGVARFTAEGYVDSTFNGNGRLMTAWLPQGQAGVTAVVVQPDGKIVVGGHANGAFALMRLAENGSLDLSFGTQGVTLTDVGGFATLNALALAPSGWLYAAGSRAVDGSYEFALAQYTPSGVLGDYPAGWAGGTAYVDWGGSEQAFAVDVRADGQVVAAGCSDAGFAWAQLPPQGVRPPPLKGETGFAGSECALGVKFTGANGIVAAGWQSFNGNGNMALARFETTPDATAPPVYPLFLPLVGG
jgi:uncharacterized delta-60 repeat protein